MDWKLVYSVAKDLLLLLALVYTWWTNREKVTARRFAGLEKEVAQRVTAEALGKLDKERDARCERHQGRTAKLETELRQVEGELRHLPNHSDIGRMHARMDELNGGVREMAGSLKALTNSVALINEHLLNQGGKK